MVVRGGGASFFSRNAGGVVNNKNLKTLLDAMTTTDAMALRTPVTWAASLLRVCRPAVIVNLF